VRFVLGEPCCEATTRPLGVSLEVWSYGSYLDWSRPLSRRFPWIAALNSYRFPPAPNEVNVYFDARGKVVSVEMPKP
jgi:hypothetical protein